MTASGYGRIINIVSTSVYEPISISECPTPFEVRWPLGEVTSRELPSGVTINNVLPDLQTPRLTQLRQGRAAKSGVSDQAVLDAWIAQVPEGDRPSQKKPHKRLYFGFARCGIHTRGVSARRWWPVAFDLSVQMSYRIVAFYQFVQLESPEELRETLRLLCHQLELKGVMLISAEGINATMSGAHDHIESLLTWLRQNNRFANLTVKEARRHTTPLSVAVAQRRCR